MSSSTSSSENPSAGGRSPRKIFALLLAVILVGMGAALAIVRVTTHLNDATAESILGRPLEARAALPRIVAEEEDLMMVFGSSMTDAGFGARQFDREVAERGGSVKSFNFGFGGLNPYFQDYLSRRIREAFHAQDRRLELGLIELCPFQLTKARWRGAQEAIDSFVTMLASPEELWEITLENPTRGIRLLNIHYLRDDISAEMITWYFGQPLNPPRPRSSLTEDEETAAKVSELGARLNELFAEEYPDWSGEQWNWEWQGAGTVPEERSQETIEKLAEYYELLSDDYYRENDRLNRIACCDILELDFEPVLVEAFIRVVKNFKEFSDRVEVILLPRNSEWIRYSPEAAARLEALIERVRTETGVEVRNYQELPQITPEMFSDTTHLARYSGDVAFTSHLVDEYGAYFGASEPAPEPAPEVVAETDDAEGS